MHLICRIARLLRFGAVRSAASAVPELWCRPATVLALRDPRRAPACLAGWR
jgi:hypothetical protein